MGLPDHDGSQAANRTPGYACAPLTEEEWRNLMDRLTLARFDRRGWEIRMLGYAEKLRLLPRLLVTIAERDAENKKLQDRIEAINRGREYLDGVIADAVKRLGGCHDSLLNGENGLAAATMREVKWLRARVEETNNDKA